MYRIKLIEKLIHFNEMAIFYPKLRRFYKEYFGSAKPIILDVGANNGQSINFFLRVCNDAIIHAFEPNKNLYAKLVKRYAANPNVHIYNLGVSNTTGKLVFNEAVMDTTSTFEELNMDSAYLKQKSKILGVAPQDIIKESYEVDVTTLHQFIISKGIDKIDVLKIDTEGHEYKCLQGLFNDLPNYNAGIIQLEQHHDDMYANKISEEEIAALLMDNGYGLYKRIRHGFGGIDEVLYKQ
jgi:FkbM family methyltransferase